MLSLAELVDARPGSTNLANSWIRFVEKRARIVSPSHRTHCSFVKHTGDTGVASSSSIRRLVDVMAVWRVETQTPSFPAQSRWAQSTVRPAVPPARCQHRIRSRYSECKGLRLASRTRGHMAQATPTVPRTVGRQSTCISRLDRMTHTRTCLSFRTRGKILADTRSRFHTSYNAPAKTFALPRPPRTGRQSS
jgi:hypothetical protein